MVVFDVLDKFLHELNSEGYVYRPHADMIDERVEKLKELVKKLPPGFGKNEMLKIIEQF